MKSLAIIVLMSLAFALGTSCASRAKHFAGAGKMDAGPATRPVVREGLARQRFVIIGRARDGTELGRLPFGEAIRDGRIVSIDTETGDELSLPANLVLNHLERSGDRCKRND